MGSCISSDGGEESSNRPSSPCVHMSSKKRCGSKSSSSFNELLKINGRMCFNGSSSCASLSTRSGSKGINQDAMIVWENFGLMGDAIFCGVFDGHGPYGHMVARRVRDSLPLKLSSSWEETGLETHTVNFLALKDSFLIAFQEMDKELKCNAKINCFTSGTTAVTLIKRGQDLVLGNVGDSRAILGTREEDGSLVAVQLTVDLKPNSPGEEQRIKRCKGRIFALRGEPDVQRIWSPDFKSPGLAMARAFGDFCLKDFGLISVPEVSYRRLTERDEFVVLATDGIWDVLSNTEVVDIVASSPSRSRAAHRLVQSAVRAWKYKFSTSKIDDCAVVCLYLNGMSSSIVSYADRSCHVRPPDETGAGAGVFRRSGTIRSSHDAF